MKAYGELPENAKINETDTFGEEEGECTFEFGDDDEVDIGLAGRSAILDTGTTLCLVADDVVDAIYGTSPCSLLPSRLLT